MEGESLQSYGTAMIALASIPNSIHHFTHSLHTEERGPSRNEARNKLDISKPIKSCKAKEAKFREICNRTGYITRIEFCNGRKAAIRPRLAVRMIRLIVRVKQHTLEPAVHSREKLQREFTKCKETQKFGKFKSE